MEVLVTTPEKLASIVSQAVTDALPQKMREPKPDAEELLSREDACRLVGVNVTTLKRWERAGALRRLQYGRVVRYRRSDVLAVFHEIEH